MAVKFEFDAEKKRLEFGQSALRSEQTFRRYAEEATTTDLAVKHDKLNNVIAFAEAIGACGFDVNVGMWSHDGFTFRCDRKDLPKLYKGLGHLKVMCKEIENARRRLLKVTLTCDKFPDYCRIEYQKKMPRGSLTGGPEAAEGGGNQRCKLVRVIQPRKVEYRLECSSS